MSRFPEVEVALIERLSALKASPEISINLNDIFTPMKAAGFSQDEVMTVLNALEQEKIITHTPGNRILVLKNLPS